MNTEQWLNQDKDFSWHPFTQMQEYLNLPRIQIGKGEGSWLFDTDGNRYLDASASIWTNVHGHNHPVLNQAITDQLQKVAHSTLLGVSHPKASELAEKLTSISPDNITRCFYSDNGSNAVEIALKMSFQYWQLVGKPDKQKVISLENSYHGDTFGTMSVGDCGAFHQRFQPWFFSCKKIPSPHCHEINKQILHEDSKDSIVALENLLKKHSNSIACLIVEPSVQGAGGMKLLPESFLKETYRLCKKYNIHLIVDEVFVGFGRLGELLQSSKSQIEPDFICCAKGLTAGYIPLAATLSTEEIYSKFLGKFSELKALFHGHTFTGNPLGCAVALASIELLETEITSGSLHKRISSFGDQFEKFVSQLDCIKNPRQRGLIAAVDLVQKNGNAFPPDQRFGMQVCIHARKHQILLRPLGDSLLIVPPISINKSEMEHLFSNLLLSINETMSQ